MIFTVKWFEFFSLSGTEMDPDRISHIIDDPEPKAGKKSSHVCENIKSRRHPKQRCDRPATHGIYCGLHFKHPRPYVPTPKMTPVHRPATPAVTLAKEPAAAHTIQNWYKRHHPTILYRRHGPAYFDRSLSVNDSDFFSTEFVRDISGVMFFSYCDDKHHVYSFDIRSIYTLVQRSRIAGESATNPFTREVIPSSCVRKVLTLAKWLSDRHVSVEWAPLAPPTPEQQWRMKVVDLFNKIDELNYYSSPDWFISLDLRAQKKFYTELHAIWTHRAGLSIQQKNMIVPNFSARLFRYAPWALFDQTLESMQRLNMGVIRMFISSAADKNDRILGAMYVISGLTMVSDQARTAYPWLYESVAGEPAEPAPVEHERRFTLGNLVGIGWLGELIALAERDRLPPLRLPPPAADRP